MPAVSLRRQTGGNDGGGQYLRDKVILQRAQNVEIRKRLQQMQEPISFDIGLTPSATFSFALPRLCTYVNRNAEPRIQFHVSNTRRLLRGHAERHAGCDHHGGRNS